MVLNKYDIYLMVLNKYDILFQNGRLK